MPKKTKKVANKAVANQSALVQRSRLAGHLGYSHQGARDLYTTFGYNREPSVLELFGLYQRNDVANRIVRAFPQATWRVPPKVGDDRGTNVKKGEDGYSKFADEVSSLFEAHDVLHFMERADRVASVGRYGGLVMGFADGRPLDQPLQSRRAKLLYLQPYGETSLIVDTYDTNDKSPRYGLPMTYRLHPSAISTSGNQPPSKNGQRVHYSRVLHISEFLEEDGVFGMPRLLPIYNRLMDLEKVVGGGAELFWLNASRNIIFKTVGDANLDDEMIEKMKTQADELQHQLRRYLVSNGVEAQVLSGQVFDTDKHVGSLLDLIAGAVGMPKRILIGSERGELSSEQDENNWSQRVDERRHTYARTRLLVPFIHKMIETGNLSKPVGKVFAEWPRSELGPKSQLELNERKANMISRYVSTPGMELYCPVEDFYRDFLDMAPPKTLPNVSMHPELEEEVEEDEKEVSNASPRSLYFHRPLLNATPVYEWAKENGFSELAIDLHVTIGYSRKKFDWMKIGADYESRNNVIVDGGPRTIELFGEGDNLSAALEFTDPRIEMRHKAFRDAGGEHDYDEYRPHVTFSVMSDKAKLRELVAKAKPYVGPLVFGPEVFAELTEH